MPDICACGRTDEHTALSRGAMTTNRNIIGVQTPFGEWEVEAMAEQTRLEQKCVKPGHWRIEGYDVIREDASYWTETVWHIEHFGERVATAVSLSDARMSIRARLLGQT